MSRLHAQLLATFGTLLLGLSVTAVAWLSADEAVESAAQREFAGRVAEARDAIRSRMLVYAQVLRGAAGLLAASDEVTRADWRIYVQSLQLDTTYPGILGLGVLRRVGAAEVPAHESALRREGFDDYAVYPAGLRGEYLPVVYIEPAERHPRVLGFDMSSDAVRNAALQRAADTGDPAVSGQIRLITDREADRQKRSGFMMSMPFYEKGAPAATAAQRREALRGFVYASFRTREVLAGVLGATPTVRIEIFDGLTEEPSTLLYDSDPGSGSHALPPRYMATTKVLVQDRAWTLRTSALPAFEQRIDHSGPRATLAAGIALSFMLALVIAVLLGLRGRATRLAERMTEALRESREQLSLALEGSNLALFDWDVRTGTVTLSERWNTMRGGRAVPTTTTIGALQGLVHPDDMPRLQQALRLALKGATPFYHVEHRVRGEDGTWRWIASHAKVAQRDGEGRALRVTGTNADITERKMVEDLKNDFIGTVSHELRTPLTALIGALALLKEEHGERLPPDAATFLDMACQNGERLAALVNDILDLEKVEAGRLELDLAPIDLEAFLVHAIALNAAYADRHGTRFELAPLSESLRVVADRERLLQVLTNLLSNAAKYSPRGAAVTVSAQRNGDAARVEVRDHGAGIPDDFKERIFQKFAQAQGPDQRSKGGTGLGLAISKAMIEAMGGRIGYTRAAGETVFFFEVPIAAASS